ncbi:hypothetical protein QQZ08_004627 [Neonectria magnoliae]|uniref:C2H2-type domain-containing protein n=1 Tax=Neonectria magnoliae TaxID=2732573 RepID=A0ABR1I7E0_9HYPO
MTPPPTATDDAAALEAAADGADNRRYPCTVPGCQRAYRRNEHLLRHLRAHALKKPYDCPKCRRSYGRQDVLKRHIAQQHGASKPHKSQGLPGRNGTAQGSLHTTTYDALTVAQEKDQRIRPSHAALPPSRAQNDSRPAAVDGQWHSTECPERRQSSRLGTGEYTLMDQGPSLHRGDAPDVEPMPFPSVADSNTILQMVLDSHAPWLEFPATPVSSLHSESSTAPAEEPGTVERHPAQPSQAPRSVECPALPLWDEPTYVTSGLEPDMPNLQDNLLSTGISEVLHDMGVQDFCPHPPSGSLGHHVQPPGVAGNSSTPPQHYFSVDSPAFQQCLDTYFERFHHQWPIVHQSSFKPMLENRDLVNSMVMVGAWESGIASWMEMALHWNESLLNKLSKHTVGLPHSSESEY